MSFWSLAPPFPSRRSPQRNSRFTRWMIAMANTINLRPDVVLIGAGIMSATLGVFLKELEPSLDIEMFERLDDAARESSEAWNNAGTGHAANCEMNYTPELSD